jgi:pimeloyl-ACP methyl ester carboxylesterase
MAEIALDPGEAFAQANGIRLCYQTFGGRENPAVLLIMGLGAHMIQWDDEFCLALAERGFFVIRFDNRDVGKSSKIEVPAEQVDAALKAAMNGEPFVAPYRLSDMADDALALLDALGISRAKIVGASMGGAIAQGIAIRHPERASALVSIMSTSGERDLPPPNPEVIQIFLKPPPRNEAEYVEANVEAWRLMRPGDYPEETARDRARAERAAKRAPLCPEGGARQLLAYLASGGRREALRAVKIPTLVIHGADDPLVPLACGEDVARAIPGARLLALERMGHALPMRVWPQILAGIAEIA